MMRGSSPTWLDVFNAFIGGLFLGSSLVLFIAYAFGSRR